MKLRYIIIAVALLLVAAGGLYFFVFNKQKSEVDILEAADDATTVDATVDATTVEPDVDVDVNVDDIPMFTPLSKLVAARQRG